MNMLQSIPPLYFSSPESDV